MDRITVNARTKGADGYVYDRWNRMTPASLARWQAAFRQEHPVIAAAYGIRPAAREWQGPAWLAALWEPKP